VGKAKTGKQKERARTMTPLIPDNGIYDEIGMLIGTVVPSM
jgi:hypothetical protein